MQGLTPKIQPPLPPASLTPLQQTAPPSPLPSPPSPSPPPLLVDARGLDGDGTDVVHDPDPDGDDLTAFVESVLTIANYELGRQGNAAVPDDLVAEQARRAMWLVDHATTLVARSGSVDVDDNSTARTQKRTAMQHLDDISVQLGTKRMRRGIDSNADCERVR